MSEQTDFTRRREIAGELIRVAKNVMRTVNGSPCDESELRLAGLMIEMRELLMAVRDEGLREPGPPVDVASFKDRRFKVHAYANFVEAFEMFARQYGSIQQARNFDVDWYDAKIEANKLRDGILLLVDFLGVAHAIEHATTLQVARAQIQLASDRKLTNQASGGDDGSPLIPDDGPLEIDADELIKLFPKAKTRRAIKKSLNSAKVTVTFEGSGRIPKRWERGSAIAHIRSMYGLKPNAADGPSCP